MELYSNEPRMMNRDTAQLMIEEMKNELERQKKLLDKKDREIEELQHLLNNGNSRPIQGTKERPDNQSDSLDMVYNIVSNLEKYTNEEVLFYAAPLLAELMNTKDAAVYMAVNRDYARLFSATSQKARSLGNSIKYSALEDIYSDLKERQIYINTSGKADRPLMASGVYAEDELQIILMFWGIPKQQITLHTANRLTAITILVQNAVLRAKRCMASFRRKNYMEGTNVLNEDAFTSLVRAFLEAKSNRLTECTLVKIVMGYQNYHEIAEKIACNIRQTDYMGIMDGGKLYILLSNTDIKNAEIVKQRLLNLGYQSVLEETLE